MVISTWLSFLFVWGHFCSLIETDERWQETGRRQIQRRVDSNQILLFMVNILTPKPGVGSEEVQSQQLRIAASSRLPAIYQPASRCYSCGFSVDKLFQAAKTPLKSEKVVRRFIKNLLTTFSMSLSLLLLIQYNTLLSLSIHLSVSLYHPHSISTSLSPFLPHVSLSFSVCPLVWWIE